MKIVDCESPWRKTPKIHPAVARAFNIPYYAAPEIIHNRVQNDRHDLWSVGAILYTILGGIPPFYDLTYAGTVEKL